MTKSKHFGLEKNIDNLCVKKIYVSVSREVNIEKMQEKFKVANKSKKFLGGSHNVNFNK